MNKGSVGDEITAEILKILKDIAVKVLHSEFIWISSNEMDETGAHYTEWSKPER